jgi:hypothetical protein
LPAQKLFVAQLVEQLTLNQRVVGSSPTEETAEGQNIRISEGWNEGISPDNISIYYFTDNHSLIISLSGNRSVSIVAHIISFLIW